MKPVNPNSLPDPKALVRQIKAWGAELGFQKVGITDTDLSAAEVEFNNWLKKGFHADMHYMEKHGSKRTRPAELEPGTISVISARMNYYPESRDAWEVLAQDDLAYVSRYALGRDYHKLMRKRLQQLARQIATVTDDYGYRVFADSAPVLEKPLADKAGLGWTGKHSNIISREAGSWFFLGEIYTSLPLPADAPVSDHCGRCTACIDICPTQAIVAPYQVDARRCISYLTIENHGGIPVELRPLIGNRIYGCDDCQLICPWNRFARPTELPDFGVRNGLDSATLLELFSWPEEAFLQRLEGSPIRRIGHRNWLRNIAVALGNGKADRETLHALEQRGNHSDPLLREHINWALDTLKKQERD